MSFWLSECDTNFSKPCSTARHFFFENKEKKNKPFLTVFCAQISFFFSLKTLEKLKKHFLMKKMHLFQGVRQGSEKSVVSNQPQVGRSCTEMRSERDFSSFCQVSGTTHWEFRWFTWPPQEKVSLLEWQSTPNAYLIMTLNSFIVPKWFRYTNHSLESGTKSLVL